MADDPYRRNPFQDLYLTEAFDDPDAYWRWFSPSIITGETTSLFKPGNVVLLGSNGAGKTMLLRLFAPEVHAAFIRAGHAYPLSEEDRRFIAINLHIIHAGLSGLGGRRVSADPDENRMMWPLMVADLMNYFFVGELCRTLTFLSSPAGAPLAEFVGCNVAIGALDEFSRLLAEDDCWYGALAGTMSFQVLNERLRDRISRYRAFINWNTQRLPRDIQSTKTAVGGPLLAARSHLSDSGVLPADVPLIVTVDQYESLIHIDYETEKDPNKSLGRAFLRVVNTFLASRTARLSFKLGVRPYSWGRELRALGTDAKLEFGRDYQVVNLDAILRRKENTSAWIFPSFARDVASRRIAVAMNNPDPGAYKTWLDQHLAVLKPEDELDRYCHDDPERLLPKQAAWGPVWQKYLRDLYAGSKFKARLVEVWLRQRLGRGERLPDNNPSSYEAGDWAREWWQKERREALLIQSASRCRQRRLYGGMETVLTLSGSNILVFVSLCREIWDSWQRARARAFPPPESVAVDVQSQAIWSVAEAWFNKQDEFSGGSERRNFIGRLGIGIRKALLRDEALVYPGHTGFSLPTAEYDETPAVKQFLDNATDFGALVSFPHTTKEKDRKPRRKWYLFPMLCPHFEIPAVRTKEPYYATATEVVNWLSDARPPVEFAGPRTKRGRLGRTSPQLPLFSQRSSGRKG